jgi:hypothetical protein
MMANGRWQGEIQLREDATVAYFKVHQDTPLELQRELRNHEGRP